MIGNHLEQPGRMGDLWPYGPETIDLIYGEKTLASW